MINLVLGVGVRSLKRKGRNRSSTLPRYSERNFWRAILYYQGLAGLGLKKNRKRH